MRPVDGQKTAKRGQQTPLEASFEDQDLIDGQYKFCVGVVQDICLVERINFKKKKRKGFFLFFWREKIFITNKKKSFIEQETSKVCKKKKKNSTN